MSSFARSAVGALAVVPMLLLSLFGGCAPGSPSGPITSIPEGMDSMTFLVSGMT